MFGLYINNLHSKLLSVIMHSNGMIPVIWLTRRLLPYNLTEEAQWNTTNSWNI